MGKLSRPAELNRPAGLRRRALDWFKRQPLPLKALLVVSPLVLGKVVDAMVGAAAKQAGLPEWSVALAVIGLLATVALLSLGWHRTAPLDPLPPVDLVNVEVRRAFSPADLAQIRHGLHRDIYGGVAPEDDALNEMYQRNPCMGVALYDRGRDDFVAFATGWPLREEAALRILSGAMSENDLAAADILPEADNCRARYVLVPAFGASGEDGSEERKSLGIKLYYEFRRTLRRNFLADRRRRITLVATGFSEKGREWCRFIGMTESAMIEIEAGKPPVPVFRRELGFDDLD